MAQKSRGVIVSNKVVSISASVEAHENENRAPRAAAARVGAIALHGAVVDHSSMQNVADALGVSKSLVRDWCDPDSGKSIAAPDIWRLPSAVRRAYARALLASSDGDLLAVEREKQMAHYAEVGRAALEMAKKVGAR